MQVKSRNMITICLVMVFLAVFSLAGIMQPDRDISESERRKLAGFPVFTAEKFWDGSFMTDFEAYALDQFFLRDGFRKIKAYVSTYVLAKQDNNGIYRNEDHAIKIEYPLDRESVVHATDRFRYLYDTYMLQSNVKIYVSIVPDKNYFSEEKTIHPYMDYDKLTDIVQKRMEYATYIDIMPHLELDDYYKTDAHWRQEKLTDVAALIAERMGTSLDMEYEIKEATDSFKGVYYGQSALSLNAEKMVYVDNEAITNCTVFDYETKSNIPVYNMQMLDGYDPYEMFLSGSKSLLTIENKEASSSKELIIFRDSFGSSIAPYFVDGYKKITLVDIRYISPVLLGQFIEFDDQDVLFLYSTTVLNNSITFK